jgi:hypothetical protein
MTSPEAATIFYTPGVSPARVPFTERQPLAGC